MMSLRSTRIVAWAFVMALGLGWEMDSTRTLAQDKEPAGPKAASKKLSGRLPPHFPEVVTPQQREAIYQIQGEYSPRIKELQTKLAALTKERADRIASLLTPEQKQKLEKAKETAAAKRAARAGGKPAEAK